MWAIKQVTPAEGFETTDKIRIDPATGVISVDAGNELPLGASYTLDLTVTNSFGSADFEGAYTLTVIEYIAPIEPETFSYAPVEVVEGTNFTAPKADGFVGDEVSFSLGDVPRRWPASLRSMKRRARSPRCAELRPIRVFIKFPSGLRT